MKKLIILIAVAMSFLLLSSVEVHALATDKLVVHYYRFDGDYDDWSLWIWPYEPNAGSGVDYGSTGDDGYGKVYEIDLTGSEFDGTTSVGLIVRTADWVKDVSIDRFIDVSAPNGSGEVHVYLVQNNPTIAYDINDADISNKILSASFTDENTISYSATAPSVAGDVSLYANDILVPISNFSSSGSNASFDIDTTVDLTKKYRLELDFGNGETTSLSVTFDGFYTSDIFNDQFGYDGELGAIYTEASTTFKLWAPISDAVSVNLYSFGHTSGQLDNDGIAGDDDPYVTTDMVLGEKGVWSIEVIGDLDGIYYTYDVTNGLYTNEVMDPYAYTAGLNGKRGMVIDFDSYNPIDWDPLTKPDTMNSYTDSIIYELHVRDLTSHETWTGTEDYRGKLLGLVEPGTTYSGVTTGFDHILELGVTHVQLVPVFDHGIIDESRLDDPTYAGVKDTIFNWGYMPENFNVVEGSYSTDPYNGEVRTTEFKTLVKEFHDNDVRVIMDVVYNHTGKSADSNFDLILPGYYFRMNPDGTFSNGSGTGNETASERYMFNKYMVDSLVFWATEYNIDGFRFDLMKLHDIDTMNDIVDALHAIDPTIIVLGEPWTGGTSTLPEYDAAYNANLDQMPGVAVFNDDTRDGIKGSVFEVAGTGFVQGNNFSDARVMLGITGATLQDNLSTASLPKGAWAIEPTQTINYVTAHDNNTLYDKLVLSTHEIEERIIEMQRQANAIILTSQGIPFLHSGVEFLRSKPCTVVNDEAQGECDSANIYDHNSYRSPDETNQFDYNLKVQNLDTFNYYKNLIALRKMKDVFTLDTSSEIADAIEILPSQEFGLISYMLHDEDDLWKTIYVVHNNGDIERDFRVNTGTWNVVSTTDEIGEISETSFNGDTIPTLTTLYVQQGEETITLDKNETLIMFSTTTQHYVEAPEAEEINEGSGIIVPLIIVGSVMLIGAVALISFRSIRHYKKFS